MNKINTTILEWKNASPKDEARAKKVSKYLALGETYFTYNVPLQIWIYWKDYENPKSGIDLDQSNILNYMPRKERCEFMKLSEVFSPSEDITVEIVKDFLHVSSLVLKNLADQFTKVDFSSNEAPYVYYANA